MLSAGVGFPLTIWFAMLHIFCFAPSMSPPIDPVVSRQNTTSTFG